MLLKEKVELTLKQFPECRESDLKLFVKIVNRFYDCWILQSQVDKLLKAPEFASIIRIRSEFQNKKYLYLASPAVQKMRGQKYNQYKNEYSPLASKPF